MIFKRVILVLILLLTSIISFSQKPTNGKYLFRFFDLEYGKFHGTCIVTVKDDTIKVVAKEDCHRKPNQLITEGTLKKHNNAKWVIIPFIKNEDDYFDTVDFKKKIFYTY